MKVVVPVLEGYNVDGQPVFGQRDATPEEIAKYESSSLQERKI